MLCDVVSVSPTPDFQIDIAPETLYDDSVAMLDRWPAANPSRCPANRLHGVFQGVASGIAVALCRGYDEVQLNRKPRDTHLVAHRHLTSIRLCHRGSQAA